MILLVTLLIVSAALLALLQLPESRDLITSRLTSAFNESFEGEIHVERLGGFLPFHAELYRVDLFAPGSDPDPVLQVEDRKSTRLNSSHVAISYAVFCLKKKK